MIFYRDYINVLLSKDSLEIDIRLDNRNWYYYSEQYTTAFFILLSTGGGRKSFNTCILNAKFMPFLFLMRHSLELLMKEQIMQNGSDVLKGHNLKDLAVALGIDVKNFLDDFTLLLPESEGDCFRYVTDNSGVRFFTSQGAVSYFETCNHFISYYNKVRHSAVNLLPEDRIIKNTLTFYPREVTYNGVIATHYDVAIYDLLKAIEAKIVTVQHIYLPLLFLIRHSLELKLKQAIESIGDEVNVNDKNIICKSHSVSKIFIVLNKYINDAINRIPSQNPLKQESLCYQMKAVDFQQQINQLDANSYVFRFPTDRKGMLSNYKPGKSDLHDALRLYVEADTFLVFAVNVLAMNGYLMLGDDVMHELMG